MAGITDIKIGEAVVSTTNPLPIASVVGGAAVATTNPMPVSSAIQFVTVSPTLDTSAYTGGDTLFDTTAIAGATRAADIPCILQSVTILDEDDQTAANMTLFFLDANVTFGTINSAPSITDANARNIQGTLVMASGSFIDVGGSKVAHSSNLNMVLKPATGTTTIYVAAMTAGTTTQTAAGVKLRFGFLSL